MASISSLGVGSGLDLTGLLEQLRQAERAKLEPIQDQLQSSAQALNDVLSFESLTTNDSEGYRLAVNATDTGAGTSIQSTNFSEILTAGVQTSDAQLVQAGQDAAFNVNGIDIVSPTNQVEGAIQGVTFILSEAGATSTVSVE